MFCLVYPCHLKQPTSSPLDLLGFKKEKKESSIWRHLDRDDLCTLAFLISNHETSSARLLVANLLKPPSTLLPSASLPDQDFNYLKSHPFRRSRKSRRGKVANT